MRHSIYPTETRKIPKIMRIIKISVLKKQKNKSHEKLIFWFEFIQILNDIVVVNDVNYFLRPVFAKHRKSFQFSLVNLRLF